MNSLGNELRAGEEALLDPVVRRNRAAVFGNRAAHVLELDGRVSDLKTFEKHFIDPAQNGVADGERHFWEAQCGLAEEALFPSAHTRATCSCASLVSSSEEVLVIPDTAEDHRTADDPFFRQREIRFYAGTPLRKPDGDVIGALCVLDTRPREISDKHKELLLWIAEVVTTTIELSNNAPDRATREAAIELEPERDANRRLLELLNEVESRKRPLSDKRSRDRNRPGARARQRFESRAGCRRSLQQGA